MSRAQADQVALAVDGEPQGARTVLHTVIYPMPNWELFYRNAIASGSIVPPTGDDGRDSMWAYYACGVIVLCCVAFVVAMTWGR